MGVTHVALRHVEAVHLAPLRAVTAGQDEDGGSGMHHVAVWAGAEGEIVTALVAKQVGEGVVLAVVKNAADGFDANAWGGRGCRSERRGGESEQESAAMNG